VLVVILPVASGVIAYRLCREIAVTGAGRRRRPAIVVRKPGGGYEFIEPAEETVESV
jgi:hypothetical protein